MATARKFQTHFLFRLVHNRVAQPVPTSDEQTRLMEAARRVVATTTVNVAGRGGRPANTVTVILGAVRRRSGRPGPTRSGGPICRSR